MATQAGPVATFADALAGLDVDLTRTSPEACESVLANLLADREAAVGAPLPYQGVALPEDVNTDPTPRDLHEAAVGVTPAIVGIAEYGTVLLESDEAGTEPCSLYPEVHVAVLRAADLVPDAPAAFEELGPHLREDRASVILATGPSATADMGALVVGAHGPSDVHVVLLEAETRAEDENGGVDQ